MLGLLNTVLSKGNTLLTYVKDGLVMANRFLTPPKLTFPVSGSAAFNGTSDFIDLSTDLDEQLDGDFTISAWVNTDTTATQFIFNSITSLGTKIIAGIRFSDLGFWLGVDNGTQYWARSGSALNTGEWYYCTATFLSSSNTIKIFLNGSDTTTVSPSIAGFGSGSGYVVLGKRNGNNDSYMDGNLANVAIWNRALTSDEINSVMWKTYEQVSTTESNGLQAWYKLSADEVLSGTSTATLTTYANANSLTFEAPACVQTALNGLPDITDARLYSANYDIRVKADGGNVESLNCVETELNAIL
tara:strand:+ start:612 stop:1514 length:903 start_codon:yes stop_codon:yes gene_type:complete